jgi:hypothetical protein
MKNSYPSLLSWGFLAGGALFFCLAVSLAKTITIHVPPIPNGQAGVAYTPVTFTATGGAGNYDFELSRAIPGMTLNSVTGVLSGTPTESATFNSIVTVTDVSSNTANTAISLTIDAPHIDLVVPAGTAGNGSTGNPYILPTGTYQTAYPSYTFSGGEHGTPPYTFSIFPVPPGMKFDGTKGVLSGRPTSAGTYFFNVFVYDNTTGSDGENGGFYGGNDYFQLTIM